MNSRGGPDWAKLGAILTLVGILVAFWIGYAGSAGFRNSVDGLVHRTGPLMAVAAAVLVVGVVRIAVRMFRGRLLETLRWMRKLRTQARWWVLWRTLEGDIRSRIESLSQIGAEVFAATLRLGERRQDRRLFLCVRDAETLVRRRRCPPQAGVGGTAWAKKGCEELQRAGLVQRFADARNYEYMVWLEPAVLKSRLGDRVVEAVEGLLASRQQWRW